MNIRLHFSFLSIFMGEGHATLSTSRIHPSSLPESDFDMEIHLEGWQNMAHILPLNVRHEVVIWSGHHGKGAGL